jgi:hypothetical protein
MQGVRSGCLRLSSVLVRHGLISERDAERVLGLRAPGRTSLDAEAPDSVSPAKSLPEPSNARADEQRAYSSPAAPFCGTSESAARETQPETQAPRQDDDRDALRAAVSSAVRPCAEPGTADTERRRLGDILCARGLITPNQLLRALQEQALSRKPLGEMLVASGSISATELSEALMEQQGQGVVVDGGLFSGLFKEISERQDLRRQEQGGNEAVTGPREHNQNQRFVEKRGTGSYSGVTELPHLESEPEVRPPHTPVTRDYLCFLPTEAGYRLILRTGLLPALGDVLDLEHHEYEATKIACSPLPNDQRPCIYLDRCH